MTKINRYIFVIYLDDSSIGCIQYYNAYDFLKDECELNNLPKYLGAIEIFMKDKNYIKKNIKKQVIELFLENYVFKYFEYVFVDPDIDNFSEISVYQKAGFVLISILKKKAQMIAHKKKMRLSIKESIALEISFKKNWLQEDSLWIFGSRVDFSKKGGDIDLYIATYATTVEKAFLMKQNFTTDLISKIGDQKIDIVLNMLNFSKKIPIYQIAKSKGVKIS